MEIDEEQQGASEGKFSPNNELQMAKAIFEDWNQTHVLCPLSPSHTADKFTPLSSVFSLVKWE